MSCQTYHALPRRSSFLAIHSRSMSSNSKKESTMSGRRGSRCNADLTNINDKERRVLNGRRSIPWFAASITTKPMTFTKRRQRRKIWWISSESTMWEEVRILRWSSRKKTEKRWTKSLIMIWVSACDVKSQATSPNCPELRRGSSGGQTPTKRTKLAVLCERCGRDSHTRETCRAHRHVNGTDLSKK